MGGKSTLILKGTREMGTKGITLIELLITLALMGIVLASVFSFLSFSVNTFNRAHKKSDVQHDILMAANFITKELRTATKVLLCTSETPENYGELYNSYIGLKGEHIEHGYNGKNRTIVNNTSVIKANFVMEKDSKTVKFYITGNEDGQEYEIDSEVSLLNVENFSEGESSGSWIYYYKPFSE